MENRTYRNIDSQDSPVIKPFVDFKNPEALAKYARNVFRKEHGFEDLIKLETFSGDNRVLNGIDILFSPDCGEIDSRERDYSIQTIFNTALDIDHFSQVTGIERNYTGDIISTGDPEDKSSLIYQSPNIIIPDRDLKAHAHECNSLISDLYGFFGIENTREKRFNVDFGLMNKIRNNKF